MKLTFINFLINEARHTTPVRLAVFEIFYVRYGGENIYKYTTNNEELGQLYQAIKEDNDDFVEEFDKQKGGGVIGLPDVLIDNGIDEIEATIRKTGGFADMWEEGVVGISAKGPKHARRIALEAASDIGADDDEEDWF